MLRSPGMRKALHYSPMTPLSGCSMFCMQVPSEVAAALKAHVDEIVSENMRTFRKKKQPL